MKIEQIQIQLNREKVNGEEQASKRGNKIAQVVEHESTRVHWIVKQNEENKSERNAKLKREIERQNHLTRSHPLDAVRF